MTAHHLDEARVGIWWSALGAGVNGEVDAIAVYSGTLVAGGKFTATGDTTLKDSATGNPSPISHPLFLRQNSGPGLRRSSCQ